MIASMGWRACFKFMGVVGVIFGALGLLLVREPKRGGIKEYEDEINGVPEQQRFKNNKPENKDVSSNGEKKSLIQSFKNSLSDVIKNPVTRLCTFAACFRFVNMFSCDYFLPGFMLMNYPAYRA
jgi:sugar phosphate permease